MLTWALQAGRHHLLHVTAVQVGLHDPVQSDVWPENKFLTVVEVERDSVLQIIQQQSVFRPMRKNLTNINPIGKQQHRLWTWEGEREKGRDGEREKDKD